MPSASEFSTDPNQNVTVGGTNVAEMCSPRGINDAIRYLAAVIRDTADKVPSANNSMPISGGAFTGDITRSTRGGYLHHAGSAQTDGRVFFVAEGSGRPAASEGAVVFYYS